MASQLGLFGMQGLGGCGCSGGIQSLGSVSPDGLGSYATNGMGVSPDGLGSVDFGTVTGNAIFDAALVAGVGYFLAPQEKDRKMWALAGAAAGGLIGTVGLIAIAGLALYQRKGSE